MTELAVDTSLWIRRLRPKTDAAMRLIFFPHAGGAASFFQPLAALLDPEVEVLGVQYPGRQDRRAEPQVRSIESLADQICRAVLPLTGTPFAFFGHSMGAIVAFEVAGRLRDRDAPRPSVLIASGRRAPSSHRVERVHRLDDTGLIAEISALSGTDATLLADPDVLDMVLPPLRGDYRAIETYRMAPDLPPLDVPVVALAGDRDPRVPVEEAAAWRGHTTGPFELHVFPGGGHFYLSQFPARTAERISAALRSARPESP